MRYVHAFDVTASHSSLLENLTRRRDGSTHPCIHACTLVLVCFSDVLVRVQRAMSSECRVDLAEFFGYKPQSKNKKRKSSDDRKIMRKARIQTKFGPNRSHRCDLYSNVFERAKRTKVVLKKNQKSLTKDD